ncbi:HemY protein [Alteromonadaceae bacterium Bs31]|nr:HemY protein [Alteromonadaceae bacterium Bs31]
MRGLFGLGGITLVLIVAGPLLLEIIKKDSGYILISIGNKTIESSFWVGVLLVLFIAIVAYYIVKLIKIILRSFGVSFSFFANAKSRQYSRRTQRGLIHYIEGNWRAAKNDLLSVAKHSDQPLVHYLAAAHSAHELGDAEESQRLLALAEEKAPANELAVLLSQAKMQLADHKYEKSLASLQRALSVAPSHPVVLDLLRENYIRLQDWPALIELLPLLKSSKQYSREAFSSLQIKSYQSYLGALSQQVGDADGEEKIWAAWESIPKPLRQSPELLSTFATILLKLAQYDRLEPLLRRVLKKQWSAELLEAYGLTRYSAPSEQLLVAEQWSREHPGDAALLLALARISMRNELWGKARNYYESSLQLRPQPTAYAELAALMAQLGDHRRSTELYQKGLLLTTQKH